MSLPDKTLADVPFKIFRSEISLLGARKNTLPQILQMQLQDLFALIADY